MRISLINEQQFDVFASNHEYSNYYQSSSYGNVMNEHNLKTMYLGFYEGAELVGASLILYKPAFVGFKYGYAPRGLLIDYANYSQVNNITKELKNYLFKEKFILLKIDPLILLEKKDKTGKVIEQNPKKDNIMTSLKDAGFYHCGFNNNFESLKPRTVAYLDLEKKEEELFINFAKQVRNKIRKANKFGIEIYKDNEALDKIYPFIENKGKYSLKYYKNLKKFYKDKMEVYVAKINTAEHVENCRLLYEKELEYNEYLNNIISRDGYKGKDMKDILNKKMESDKILVNYKEYLVNSITLLRDYPEGLIIAGTIIIKDNNTVHLLIDGYDNKHSKFYPLYLTRWEIIKEYHNTHKYFNLNGISNNFDKEKNKYKGLNETKFGFNTIGYEYIGEFNLIVNNPIYTLYRSLLAEDSFKNIDK